MSPIEHPSTSKQHVVLQFWQLTERNEFGDTSTKTKPFIIDLESANGTTVNGDKAPASRYYELRNGDVLKFAFSSREYVLLVKQFIKPRYCHQQWYRPYEVGEDDVAVRVASASRSWR